MRACVIGVVVFVVAASVSAGDEAGRPEVCEVADQIAANLRQSGQLQGYRIKVRFGQGTAWVSGHVRSKGQWRAALQLVSDTPGVERVVDSVTIKSDQDEQTARRAPQQLAEALGSDLIARPIMADLTMWTEGQPEPEPVSQPATRLAQKTGHQQKPPSEVVPAAYVAGLPGTVTANPFVTSDGPRVPTPSASYRISQPESAVWAERLPRRAPRY